MNRTLLKFAVLSIAFLGADATVIAPAIETISQQFPGRDPSLIQSLVTLPSLTMLLTSIFFGKLSRLAKRKTLFLAGSIFFVIGGVAPTFMNDLNLILASRLVFGVGLGIINPLGNLLIFDFFKDNERASMLGLQGTSNNLGAMILQTLGGLLCVISWRYTFLTYLIMVPIYAFVRFGLPEQSSAKPEVSSTTYPARLPFKVILLELSLFVFLIFLTAFFINIAMLVVGEKLGTPATAGIALSSFTLGAMITGVFFGKIMSRMKANTLSFGWALVGIGLLILSQAHNVSLILLGCFVTGIGFSCVIPVTFTLISDGIDQSASGLAFGIAYTLMGIAQFFAPGYWRWVGSLFGESTGRFPIHASALMLIAGSLALFFLTNMKTSASSRHVSRQEADL
ncbi:MFS transporter [Paraburkholderia caffeinilytica]|uniref:MFS transporter n=1 Tax=Paraburkholderia caffeinilytica TaxID=1761016 RepID=UPI003DA01C74